MLKCFFTLQEWGAIEQSVQQSLLPLFKLPETEVSGPERKHMHQYCLVDSN